MLPQMVLDFRALLSVGSKYEPDRQVLVRFVDNSLAAYCLGHPISWKETTLSSLCGP